MLTRTISVLAVGAGLALTAAACSGASPAVAPAPVTSASPATSAAPATSASTADLTATAKQGCPVTRATLLAAMKSDKNGASQLRQGATLGEPECYAGYVLVTKTSVKDAQGKPVADDEIGRFVYKAGTWKYRGASTAGFCEGMPADARQHFETSFASGCG